MRKVKIFTDTNVEFLQRMINEWLKTHESISITDILQSESGTDDWSMTITFFYIDSE